MADYGLLALQEQGQMDRDRAGTKRKSEKKKRKKRSKWISGLGTVGGIVGGLAMNALIPGSGLGLMMASMATGAAAGAGTALGQGIGRGVSKHKGWGADRNLGQGRSVLGGSISAQQNVADAFYGDQDAYNQMEKAGYQSDIINNMMTGAMMQFKGGTKGLEKSWASELKDVGGKLKARAGGLADMLPQRPQSEWEIASQQIKDQSLESAYGPRAQLGYGSYAQYGAREFGKGTGYDNMQRELFQGGLNPNTGGTRPMTWTPRAMNPENYMDPQFGRSTLGSLAGDTGWIESYPGLSLSNTSSYIDEPLNLRMSSRLGNRVNTGGSGYGFYTGGPLDQLMGMQRNRPLNMWSQ